MNIRSDWLISKSGRMCKLMEIYTMFHNLPDLL